MVKKTRDRRKPDPTEDALFRLGRVHIASFEDWYYWAQRCDVTPGLDIPTPVCRQAWLIADREGWIEKYRMYPDEWVCEREGLPKGFGRPAKPFSEEFRKRLLATVAIDPAFAKEFSRLVREAVKK